MYPREGNNRDLRLLRPNRPYRPQALLEIVKLSEEFVHMHMPADLVSVKNAAIVGGWNPETVRRWYRKGLIARYGRTGSTRVSLSEALNLQRTKTSPLVATNRENTERRGGR